MQVSPSWWAAEYEGGLRLHWSAEGVDELVFRLAMAPLFGTQSLMR